MKCKGFLTINLGAWCFITQENYWCSCNVNTTLKKKRKWNKNLVAIWLLFVTKQEVLINHGTWCSIVLFYLVNFIKVLFFRGNHLLFSCWLWEFYVLKSQNNWKKLNISIIKIILLSFKSKLKAYLRISGYLWTNETTLWIPDTILYQDRLFFVSQVFLQSFIWGNFKILISCFT